MLLYFIQQYSYEWAVKGKSERKIYNGLCIFMEYDGVIKL